MDPLRVCRPAGGQCSELLRREVSLFLFAFVSGVEPTNNAAERAVAETKPRSQEYGEWCVPGMYLVGGGDVPSAGSQCVGIPDRERLRRRRRVRSSISVDSAKCRACCVTFRSTMNDFFLTCIRREIRLIFSARWMSSPRSRGSGLEHTVTSL